MIGQGVTVHVQTQIATNMHELARFGHTSVLPGHRILGSNFPAHGNSKMMSLQRVVCRSVSLTRSHSTTPFLFPTAARFPSARHFATSGKPKSRGEIDEDVEDEKMLMGSLIGKQKLNSLEDQFDVLAGDLDEMLDRKTNPPARAPSSPAANPPKPDTKEVEQSLVEDKDAASSEEPLSEDELRLQKKEERKKHIYGMRDRCKSDAMVRCGLLQKPLAATLTLTVLINFSDASPHLHVHLCHLFPCRIATTMITIKIMHRDYKQAQ